MSDFCRGPLDGRSVGRSVTVSFLSVTITQLTNFTPRSKTIVCTNFTQNFKSLAQKVPFNTFRPFSIDIRISIEFLSVHTIKFLHLAHSICPSIEKTIIVCILCRIFQGHFYKSVKMRDQQIPSNWSNKGERGNKTALWSRTAKNRDVSSGHWATC